MRSLPAHAPLFFAVLRFVAVRILSIGVVCGLVSISRALESGQMDGPAPGLVETGAPLFAIHAHEALGVNVPPSDLHLLPDGRILVVAGQQLAFGDGVRWEVSTQAADDPPASGASVAIGSDGRIYAAAPSGLAQVDFSPTGDWRMKVRAPWPIAGSPAGATPRAVIDTPRDWFWHSGSGRIIAWRPHEAARVVGHANSIQHIFQLNAETYMSDRTTGELWRFGLDAMEPVAFTASITASDTITCATSFDATSVLVGTYRHGLALFDGHTLRPFVTDGLLASDIRINDVCATAGGFYAAAVENFGIVFFDRQGRTIQVLDRTYDHRLSHITGLVAAPGGVLWGLLADGVLQVEFPSRISYFEPLIGSGIDVALPVRSNGRLWMMADGYIYRGTYDRYGRLTGLAIDTPPRGFAANPAGELGFLITTTDRASYRYGEFGWMKYADIAHLMVLKRPAVNGRWLYAASRELGWIGTGGNGIELERFPEPRLNRVYGSVSDDAGNTWLELGQGQLGRVRIVEGQPRVDYFGPDHGVPPNWVQIFAIDGRVGFNVGDQILRFDETAQRLVKDEEFSARFPGISDIVGRPGRDALGRLWITANNRVQVLEGTNGVWRNLHEKMPPGFLPYYFTFERGGAVWMHSSGRLARYDPSIPEVAEATLRAAITRVISRGGQRHHFSPGNDLGVLPFAENSLLVHFCAPESAFKTVNFDVMLEGEGAEWVRTGSSGSAAFNHLREGRYVLHVRPQSNGVAGIEATLAFEILPPWYRTRLAYVGYVLSVVGIGWLGVLLVLYVQRREKDRLERLVALRTHEVNASNECLAAQVEQNQILSTAIEQSPAAVYITDPTGQIVFANPRACELTGRTAAQLVHQNIRTLRSDAITPDLLAQMDATVLRGDTWHGQLTNRRPDGRAVQVRSLMAPIRSADGRVHHHLIMEEDITESLNEQDRRHRLEAQLFQAQKLESIGTLAGGIAHDFNNILTAILGYCELAGLDAAGNAEVQQDLAGVRAAGIRAKELVARILTFSRQNHVQLVPLDLARPVAEAVKLLRASTPSTIEIISTLASGTIRADATQIQQIVLNLGTNAVQAMPDQHGKIEISVQRVEVSAKIAAEVPQLWVGAAMQLVIADHGCGMDESTLRRIFDPFFTTKPLGKGTGLGLAIVQGVVASHAAAITVRSAPGVGSSFEIYFRLCEETIREETPDEPAPRGEQQEIIVVDDERSVADFVATRLSQLGYRPTVFSDPQAALNAFAAEPGRFQAIVTDLTMPRLTGPDLIKQIRACGWLIPAVIITGYEGDAIRVNIRALPRCLVLPKPFSGDDLARALHRVIADDGVHRDGSST